METINNNLKYQNDARYTCYMCTPYSKADYTDKVVIAIISIAALILNSPLGFGPILAAEVPLALDFFNMFFSVFLGYSLSRLIHYIFHDHILSKGRHHGC